jgi:two-component system response regulator RegA
MRNGAVDCISKLAGAEAILASLALREPQLSGSRKLRVPTLAQVEWDYIQRVLQDCGGNLTSAARVLDIPRRSLQRKLRRHAPR